MPESQTEVIGQIGPEPNKTLAFLESEHKKLTQQYSNNRFLANEVAKLLMEDGLAPHIEMVYEVRDDQVVLFLPQIYEGKMSPWHAHFVCCTENQAFDPILGYPINKENYTKELFGQEIEMKVSVPAEDMDKYSGNFYPSVKR